MRYGRLLGAALLGCAWPVCAGVTILAPAPARACILYQPLGCTTQPWNRAAERGLSAVSILYAGLARVEVGDRGAGEHWQNAEKALSEARSIYTGILEAKDGPLASLLNEKLAVEKMDGNKQQGIRAHFGRINRSLPLTGRQAVELAAAEADILREAVKGGVALDRPDILARAGGVHVAASRYVTTGLWVADLLQANGLKLP